MVLNVVSVRFFIVVRAESGEALITQVCLDRVDPSYEYVQPAVKFLLVQDEWVVHIPLNQVLVVESRLRQISELFQKDDAVAASSFGWLGDESLPRILPQMVLEVAHFIGQKKAVRHELVVDREESLQSTDDNAKYVLLCEVVHQWIPIKDALPHLNYVQIMIPQGHTIPQERAIPRLVGLSVPVLSNNILHRVELPSAVVGVDYYLLAA